LALFESLLLSLTLVWLFYLTRAITDFQVRLSWLFEDGFVELFGSYVGVSFFKLLASHQHQGPLVITFVTNLDELVTISEVERIRAMLAQLVTLIIFSLALIEGNALFWDAVHILQMTAQVATLSESFLALGTSEWALSSMLAEVIP
jgi:hypothetical protein